MKRLLATTAGALVTLVSATGCQLPTDNSAQPVSAMTITTKNRTALAAVPKLSDPTRIYFVESWDSISQKQRIVRNLAQNQTDIAAVVSRLKKTAGHTWYVFSGLTPAGWDCSGLVRWTYEQLGVTLEHSAVKQAQSGAVVTDPVIGDIVAYYYPGRKNAYHVGIYIGNGQMINAPRPGQVTRIESATDGEFKGSVVKYIRILAQDPKDLMIL